MLRDFFRKETTAPVDAQIDAILDKMQSIGVDSPEYSVMLTHLERLADIKAKDRHDPVNRDTIAVIAGNLLGILLIVAYEQKHVIASKGFSQIIRPK